MTDELTQRYHDIRGRVDRACARAGRATGSVRMVVVTKKHPVETILRLSELGVTDIGENVVQELVGKAPAIVGKFTIHLVGHLQTNKINKVLPIVQWIQSVDRTNLIDAIEQRFSVGTPRLPVLVQVNTSGESSKSGCTPEECGSLCERVAASATLDLRGLMTIGPVGGDERALRASFQMLRRLSEGLSGLPRPELSMGMSDDFEWAVEEGATIVRIGTALLGDRTPTPGAR